MPSIRELNPMSLRLTIRVNWRPFAVKNSILLCQLLLPRFRAFRIAFAAPAKVTQSEQLPSDARQGVDFIAQHLKKV